MHTNRPKVRETLRSLTPEKALSLLEQAVNEKGEKYIDHEADRGEGVFVGCEYFSKDGSPSCIVGHVLAYEGVKLDDFIAFVGHDDEDNEMVEVDQEVGVQSLFDDYTDPVADILYAAQRVQDGGYTWGKALEEARAVARSFDKPEVKA